MKEKKVDKNKVIDEKEFMDILKNKFPKTFKLYKENGNGDLIEYLDKQHFIIEISYEYEVDRFYIDYIFVDYEKFKYGVNTEAGSVIKNENISGFANEILNTKKLFINRRDAEREAVLKAFELSELQIEKIGKESK